MAGKILIHDVIASNRIILRCKLSAACYDVIQADSHDDLLRKVRTETPDLVICDLDQAPRQALALCRHLCGTLAGTSVPVLLLATAPRPALRIAAVQAGAWGLLSKPLHDDLLLATLRQILRQFHHVIESRHHCESVATLGMAEAATPFGTAKSHVAIVADDPALGEIWRARLSSRLDTCDFHVHSPDQALSRPAHAPEPDVFVIGATPKTWQRNLRVLSELRSRAATRHSRLVMVEMDPPSGGPDADNRNACDTAMALDLGADDVLSGDVHAAELAIRIETQSARKRMGDTMRRTLTSGMELAARDPLTGLYNRRVAVPRLERMLRTAHERQRPMALMALDLDRFKVLNDTHGHAAGDAVLVEVSRRLSAALRPLDLVARCGGEEFWVALPDTDDAGAALTAQALRQIIRTNPIPLADRRGLVRVTMSIGVAVYDGKALVSGGPAGIARLLARADDALYAAKAEGRDKVTFASVAA